MRMVIGIWMMCHWARANLWITVKKWSELKMYRAAFSCGKSVQIPLWRALLMVQIIQYGCPVIFIVFQSVLTASNSNFNRHNMMMIQNDIIIPPT
jgi:hypothetical protein